MPILSRDNQKEFQVPPEGLYQAVCVDVTDLGLRDTRYGKKQQVDIRWMLGQVDEATGQMHVKLNDDGYPFTIMGRYTNSMNEKANLRKHIEAWRGKPFTSEEQKGLEENGFDLEKLIGANCQLQIVHNIADGGRVYANVQAIVSLDKRLPKLGVPSDYVRFQDRKKENGNGPAPADPDADIPF
jgi:hypothetical protein